MANTIEVVADYPQNYVVDLNMVTVDNMSRSGTGRETETPNENNNWFNDIAKMLIWVVVIILIFLIILYVGLNE